MYYETIQIDFNSDEAIYIQLRNQIILGIATSRIQDAGLLLPAGTPAKLPEVDLVVRNVEELVRRAHLL